jgi:cysteine desulfurase
MNQVESIYLDNNATTRPDPKVVEAMIPLYREDWGNPGSHHRGGDRVAAKLRKARRQVASAFGFSPREVVFTAGGTEADVLALRGVVLAAPQPRHLVVSAIEHPAVLTTAEQLESEGACELSLLAVDGQGRVDSEHLRSLLKPHTALVSVMSANNETGVIQPIAELAEIAHAAGARFHTDAVQAVGKIPLDEIAAKVDLLSFSAHKFHGPKGTGALLVRDGVPFYSQLEAGGQEGGRRGGTENPAGIIGLATALELALSLMEEAAGRMKALREHLEAGLEASVESLEITSKSAARSCNTTHFTVEDMEAGALLTLLDEAGIACSAGSACSTGSLKPSHVLVAQGLAVERLHGALRLSLSRETTKEEIDRVLELLPPMAMRLRSLSRGGKG